jgi:dihydroflavonol-4-reductase
VKACVTGAAGFIGSHVVRQLVDAGAEVRALHQPHEDLRNLEGLDVELVPGDVTDPASVRRLVAGCDRVFHLAAIYALWTRRPERMREVNVEGTRHVLEASLAAGVERVVYTSSIAVFGGQGAERDATEESPFRLGTTGDLYSRTKHESHAVALDFAKRLDVTIVAPCGPIGPNDVGPTPTGRILLTALEMPFLVVVDSATNFVDVRDVAAGHLLAAERGRRGETYLLGAENWQLADIARAALEARGLDKPVLEVPYAIARLGGAAMLAWTERVAHKPPLFTPAAVEIAKLGLRARTDKAERELGFAPRPVRTAVKDALTWFEDNGYVRKPRTLRSSVRYLGGRLLSRRGHQTTRSH